MVVVAAAAAVVAVVVVVVVVVAAAVVVVAAAAAAAAVVVVIVVVVVVYSSVRLVGHGAYKALRIKANTEASSAIVSTGTCTLRIRGTWVGGVGVRGVGGGARRGW